MVEAAIYNRKYTRLFFQADDDIKCICSFTDSKDEKVTANVMNISEGGICLTINRDEIISISKNDELFLLSLTEKTLTLFDTEIRMIVRWVMDNKFFKNIELGCQFLDPPDNITEQIRSLVEDRGE